MLIPIVFMVIASAALFAAIAFLWSSFRSAFGTTDAFNLPDASADSRRSLEERKTALLTNINDLEFDHQAGKVSDADFKSLHTKLRTEAKRVLRLLDEDVKPFRAQAEALVRSRMDALGTPYRDPLGSSREDEARSEEPAMSAKARKPAKSSESVKADAPADDDEAPVSNDCAECGTLNDSDAVFCKKCGSTLADQHADAAESADADAGADADADADTNADADAEAALDEAEAERAAEDRQ